jgi:hypothetical protein
MNIVQRLAEVFGEKVVERGEDYTILAPSGDATRGRCVWENRESDRRAKKVGGKWGRVGSNIQSGHKTFPGHEGDRVFYPFDGSGAEMLD